MRVMRLERGGEGEDAIMGGANVWAQIWEVHVYIISYMNVVINRGGARYAKSGPCEEGRGWGGGGGRGRDRELMDGGKQKIVHTHALLSFVSVAFVFFPPTKSESS